MLTFSKRHTIFYYKIQIVHIYKKKSHISYVSVTILQPVASLTLSLYNPSFVFVYVECSQQLLLLQLLLLQMLVEVVVVLLTMDWADRRLFKMEDSLGFGLTLLLPLF